MPAFSPACATQPPLVFGAGASGDDDDYCTTPTGCRISYLREPTTCPAAPKNQSPPPPCCRKRLFQPQPHGISTVSL
ncbi:unnamed protein product [Miscanthus lutarioriparius]|uniref:Uncharacterized protein n=1 Tax=Miscanthus lutarioriparius TaxID=422564 RepID=A0A811SL17_9POAL|nr:unnamed protein product [Miscanthus lutarioriparius]